MRLINVQIPVTYLNGIQRLVEEGAFPNRPEAIRVAIRDFLKEELSLMETAQKLFKPLPPPKPPVLSDEMRAYYRETWGFDPAVARTYVSRGMYQYEATFPLPQDPELATAGVTIAAQVTFPPQGKSSKNRIMFRCGSHEAAVTCVHTAICMLTPQEFQATRVEGLLERARRGPRIPVQLPPEEHFAALKSYVAGLAELGIRNAFHASYMSESWNPQTLPIGFDSAMQSQIARALRQVAPLAASALLRDLLFEIVEDVPGEWLRSRLPLLDSLYGISEMVRLDPSLPLPALLKDWVARSRFK